MARERVTIEPGVRVSRLFACVCGARLTFLCTLTHLQTGYLLANDANRSRTKALVGNIHRMGGML